MGQQNLQTTHVYMYTTVKCNCNSPLTSQLSLGLSENTAAQMTFKAGLQGNKCGDLSFKLCCIV